MNTDEQLTNEEIDRISFDLSDKNDDMQPLTTNRDMTRSSYNERPLFSLSDLYSRQFPDTEWIVESLIPAQGLIALSGAPGNFKSWITQSLAISVSSGAPLFDHFDTSKGSVLIIDKENNLRLIKERFTALGATDNLDIHFFNLESFDFLTENLETVELIIGVIRDLQIKLVIIDSLIRAHKQDENSASGMAQVFEALKKIQNAGAAIIFTHHHRKQSFFNKSGASESLRGSSDILAAVDCHLAVDRVEDGIKLTQTKLRQKQAIKPFKVRLDPLEDSSDKVRFMYLGEAEEQLEKAVQAKAAILEILDDEKEYSRQDLIERMEGIFGRQSIDAGLKLLPSEEVTCRTGEHNKKLYQKVGIGQLGLEEELPSFP